MLQVPDTYTSEQIDEEVTKECHCEEAKAYQYKLEEAEIAEMQQLSAKGTILDLFKEDYPNVADMLQEALIPLCAGVYTKMTVKVNDITTAHVSINSKGEIKVERVDKKKYTRITDR